MPPTYGVTRQVAIGVGLGIVVFVLVSTITVVNVMSAQPKPPIFSFTLLVPTSSPARIEWAALIANSFASANIKVNLVYLPFNTVFGRLFNCPPCGESYAAGGFDAALLGTGAGGPLPDFGPNGGAVAYYGGSASSFPPSGVNYAFFNDPVYNSLANQYASAYTQSQQISIANQMAQEAADQRPYLVIEYPSQTIAFKNYFSPWGSQNVFSGTTFPDFEHWKAEGSTTANLAMVGPVDNLNPIPPTSGMSYYNKVAVTEIYSGSAPEQFDARTGLTSLGLATSVTSSPDHKDWTVVLRSGVKYTDSADVGSDDFLFTYMSMTRQDVSSLTSQFQARLGNSIQFTFLNGTSRYLQSGTYFTSQPAGWSPSATFASTSRTSFAFHVDNPSNMVEKFLLTIPPVPMHVLEKIEAPTWSSSWFGTPQAAPTTIGWDSSRFGGNGSYAHANGPIGAGAYIFKSFDSVNQVITLSRNTGFWNSTGLQQLGEFGITTLNILYNLPKNLALADFFGGQANVLDQQYSLTSADVYAIKSTGNVAISKATLDAGWQEMGLNMNNPVFGTGSATPLGMKDPSRAAASAQLVRKAMSYLIPRQDIVKSILGGLALPGITQFSPAFGAYSNPSIKADPYKIQKAISFLAQAGYQLDEGD